VFVPGKPFKLWVRLEFTLVEQDIFLASIHKH